MSSIYADGLIGGAYSGRVDPYGAFYSDRLISVPQIDGEFRNTITNFVAGSTLTLRRVYTLNWDVWGYDILDPASGFNNDYVVNAWLTIKDDPIQPDTNSAIQKHITPTGVPNVGKIYLTGVFNSMSVTSMRFDLVPADTIVLNAGQTYFYEIRYQSNAGRVYVPESGTMVARTAVATAPLS